MKNKARLVFVIALILFFGFGLAQINDASTDYNGATQSRLRVGHLVFGGPDIDVLVNGEVAVIADRPWTMIPPGTITDYLYLAPATYSVAIVPTGEGIAEAIIGPLDVEVAAGHRYTVAMMGQTTDEKLEPLVTDETAEVQKVRSKPSQFSTIWLHNVAGVETVSFGKEMGFAGEVSYGDFGVNAIANGDERLCNNYYDRFDGEIIYAETYPNPNRKCLTWEPALDFLAAYYGSYPGAEGEGETWDYAQSISSTEQNVLEFLQGFNEVDYISHGITYSFRTFLDAVEKAGLTDMLTTGGPYRIYVPTDEAFSPLRRDGVFDALMADPEALADLLRAHIAPGYYPPGTLGIGEEYGGYGRTLTNLLGQDIHIEVRNDVLYLNGIGQGSEQSNITANGTVVRPISTLLVTPNND